MLGVQKSEWDLGVVMQSDLKMDKQCSKAANEANKMLGMINRNLECKVKRVILPLYKSIVKPHLRAGLKTALQDGYTRQVGEGTEESDQDGGKSGEYL